MRCNRRVACGASEPLLYQNQQIVKFARVTAALVCPGLGGYGLCAVRRANPGTNADAFALQRVASSEQRAARR